MIALDIRFNHPNGGRIVASSPIRKALFLDQELLESVQGNLTFASWNDRCCFDGLLWMILRPPYGAIGIGFAAICFVRQFIAFYPTFLNKRIQPMIANNPETSTPVPFVLIGESPRFQLHDNPFFVWRFF